MRMLGKLKTAIVSSNRNNSLSSKPSAVAPTTALVDRLPQLPALPNLPRRATATVRRLTPSLPFSKKQPQLDVLIIGAGISGIDIASHLSRDKLLSKSVKKDRVALVEKRAAIGGTWD